jgi:hypothetical protein
MGSNGATRLQEKLGINNLPLPCRYVHPWLRDCGPRAASVSALRKA